METILKKFVGSAIRLSGRGEVPNGHLQLKPIGCVAGICLGTDA